MRRLFISVLVVLLSSCADSPEKKADTAPPKSDGVSAATVEPRIEARLLDLIEIRSASEAYAQDGKQRFSAPEKSGELNAVKTAYITVASKGDACLEGFKIVSDPDWMKVSTEEQLKAAVEKKCGELVDALNSLRVAAQVPAGAGSPWTIAKVLDILTDIYRRVKTIRDQDQAAALQRLSAKLESYKWRRFEVATA